MNGSKIRIVQSFQRLLTNEMGCISLNIPKVPFLLPEGDEIRLSVADINTINDYINEEADHMHDNTHMTAVPETAQRVVLNAQ